MIPAYRIYFIDRLGKFRWPHDLQANEDDEALALALALQYARSDVEIGIELWQGARFILGTSYRSPAELQENWDDVCARRRELLEQAEEALFNSQGVIAHSQNLLDKIEVARSGIEAAKKSSVTEA